MSESAAGQSQGASIGAGTAASNGAAKSFVRRKIDVTIQAAEASPPFADGSRRVTLSGHRVSVAIDQQGGTAMAVAQIRIYGLPLSMMNQLSTFGRLPLGRPRNMVSITAGSDASGMGVVFTGTIQAAWADFKGSPEVMFHMTAMAGGAEALAAVAPSSFRGSADVSVIMSSLAQQMGLRFENNGVMVRLSNPYFPGTLLAQARACAEAAGIDMTIDTGVLIITPRGGQRFGQVPLVSAETGMIGYPAFTYGGIAGACIYNPDIRFWGAIEVRSLLTPANGMWRVFKLTHELEAETPGGRWFSYFEGTELSHVGSRIS